MEFDLERFVDAQRPVFDTALAELRAERKRSHWMWFVFPQLRGLGHSAMAQRYGIESRAEAQAYLKHPVLGPRLVQCTKTVLAGSTPLTSLFGSPDDVKFVSCMSLFAVASTENESVFRRALERLAGGKPDPRTAELLA